MLLLQQDVHTLFHDPAELPRREEFFHPAQTKMSQWIILTITDIRKNMLARKKERQTGREVRKKRRELCDGVYPTNPPAQNDAHQTQE